MLSKNFDSHGSHNWDSAYTEKTRFVGVFCYLSVSFPNRDVIKLIWKHFVNPKKVQLDHDVQCISISAPPHACSNRFPHCKVFPPVIQCPCTHPTGPCPLKTTVKDLCLLTKCTNTILTPTPFLPLSSFPSLLRHNLQNAHKKFSLKLVISSSTLFSIFPYFGEKQENISVSCPHTISSAL